VRSSVYLFIYFLKIFFTKIYFWFRNLQLYTLTIRQRDGRPIAAPLRAIRTYIQINLTFLTRRPLAGRRPPGSRAAGSGHPVAGRQAAERWTDQMARHARAAVAAVAGLAWVRRETGPCARTYAVGTCARPRVGPVLRAWVVGCGSALRTYVR
jgi:hypothetical protein